MKRVGAAVAAALGLFVSGAPVEARECRYYGTNGPSVYGGHEGFDARFQTILDDVGFGSMRVGFRIDTAQSWTPALLAQYDAIVEKARARGVEIMGLVLYESLRGGQADWNGPGSAAYVQRFVDVTKILFSRYGDTIKNWEIWNEPNSCNSDYLSVCLSDPQHAGVYFIKPDVFSKILAETWIQNRATIAKESLHLVMGGLYAHDVDGGHYAATDYMTQVYQQGPWDYLKANYGRRYPWDAFGFHIYTTLSASMPAATISDYLDRIAAVRRTFGDASPIWMTEFGWRSDMVGEALQSQNLTTEMGVLESRADVGRTFVFRATEYQTWGLFRADGTPKPSAAAFRARAAGCTVPPATLPAQVTSNDALAVANWPGDRHAEVLATSTTGDLVRVAIAADGTIAAPQPIGAGATCGSTAVYWPPKGNYVEAVTVAADGAARHAWERPTWNAPSDFGGAGVGLSHLSSVAWPDAHVEIFGRTKGGTIAHKFWQIGAGNWSGWEDLGGATTTGAAPVVWGDGHAEIFAVDAAGRAEHRWSGAFPGGWHAWEAMTNDPGVVLASRPAPVRRADGKVSVFARTADGRLAASLYDGDQAGWSAFRVADPKASIFGEPSAAWADGIVVVTRSPKGEVLWAAPDAHGVASLARLGDAVSVADPLAWTRADGTLDVYAIDPAGALLTAHRDATGAFGAWRRAGGAVLRACSAPLPAGPKAPDADLPRPDEPDPAASSDPGAPPDDVDPSASSGCAFAPADGGSYAAAVVVVLGAIAGAARRRRPRAAR